MYTPEGENGQSTGYEWDRNSNRTALTNGDARTTWEYRQDNSIDKRITDTDVTEDETPLETFNHEYDAAGRLTSDRCTDTAYDGFDRVKTVDASADPKCPSGGGRSTTYTYDGLDRQRTMTVSGVMPVVDPSKDPNATTASVFDGLSTKLVGQTDAVSAETGNPDVLYQLDASGNAMALKQSGNGAGTSFLDTDGRGNITNVVGTDGELGCAVVYDPFGQSHEAVNDSMCKTGTAVASTTGNAQWYRGQTRDGSTGDYQLGTRTYDPSNGAFSTPDAYRVATPGTDLTVGTDPLTANTYSYVNGNPVNMYDPSGHFGWLIDYAEKAEKNIESAMKKNSTDKEWRDYVAKGVKRTEAKLKRAQEKANEEFDWEKTILEIAGDVSGITDIKNCIMEGDVTACAWTVASIVGAAWTKIGKFVKGVRSAIKSFRIFQRGKKAAERQVTALTDKLVTLRSQLRSADRATDGMSTTLKPASQKTSSSRQSSPGGSSQRTSTKTVVKERAPRSEREPIAIFRTPRVENAAEELRQGPNPKNHVDGDASAYFGEESVAAEYAGMPGYADGMVRYDMDPEFLDEFADTAHRYDRQGPGGSARIEFQIPVDRLGDLARRTQQRSWVPRS